jgi:hypothetical protein
MRQSQVIRTSPESLHVNATHQLESVCSDEVIIIIRQETLESSVGHPQ